MTQGTFNAFDLSSARAKHRGAVTLAALAVALVAGGCGGGGGSGGKPQLSKNQYEAQVQKDGQAVRDAFKPLSTPSTSLAALATAIKKGQDKLRDVAKDLDSVDPPSDVSKDNDTLVAGLRKLADQLEPLRTAAAKGDVKGVQKAVNDIQTSHALSEAQKATADMKKKGYDIGALGK